MAIHYGSYQYVLTVLDWGPFELFERVVVGLIAELAWTDHGGTWERQGDRIQARLVPAFEPELKKFAWMEAIIGGSQQHVSLKDIMSFAARASAIGSSHGIYITTAQLGVTDVAQTLGINRPPLSIIDGSMVVTLMEMKNIRLIQA